MSGHQHHAAGRRPLALVLAITCAVLAAEVVGGVLSGSLALLADAGHMLADVSGLTLALTAAVLTGRPPTESRSWGWRRAEVLAAAVQAAVLLAVGVAVLVEAVRRLVDPPGVAAGVMLAFGAVGLAGNLLSMGVLSRASHGGGNLSLRAATLEVAADALGSTAVLLAAAVVALTGWLRADAVASGLIGVFILPRTWRLLREAVDVLLESTPRGMNLAEVRRHILEVRHVREVHDLHVSVVSTDLPVLTAHVVVEPGCFHDGHAPEVLDELQRCLAGHFDVEHSTFQLEPPGHTEHELDRHV